MTEEKDPLGKDLHSPGAKADAGKIRPALVLGGFARALTAVSDVGTYGARKYTDNGWEDVPDGLRRYDEALVRHWLAEKRGERCDKDTGLLHQAHLAWNALARLELMLREAGSEPPMQPKPASLDYLKYAQGKVCGEVPPALADGVSWLKAQAVNEEPFLVEGLKGFGPSK